MRKIINGKLYNTDTAEFVDEYTYSYPSDFNYEYEKLYRKRTGEFFLYGEGGPASKYSVCTGQNEWSGGEKLIPLSDDEGDTFNLNRKYFYFDDTLNLVSTDNVSCSDYLNAHAVSEIINNVSHDHLCEGAQAIIDKWNK